MEEHLSPASALGERIEGVAGRLEQSRSEAHRLLGNYRARLAELEATFSDRVAGLQQTQEWQQATQGQLDDVAAELTESQKQLDIRENRLTLRQQQMRDRGRRIAATFRRQRARHWRAIQQQRDQIESLASSDNEQLSEAREQLELQAQQVDALRAEIEHERGARSEDGQLLQQTRAELDESRVQCERIDQQLNAAQGELQQQCDQNRELTEQLTAKQDGDQALSQKLEDISSERAGLAAALGEAEAALQATRQERDSQTQLLEQLRTEREELAAAVGETEEALQAARQDLESQVQTQQELASERDRQATALSEAEAVIEELREQRDDRAGESEGGSQEVEDLKSRLEMSLDDLREARAKNESLERELAAACSAAPITTGGGGGGGLDWEAQKRRLLAALDAEFDGDDPVVLEQRVSFEERIQATDQAIAAKDREIEAMRQEIEQAKATESEPVDTQAEAIAEVLNHDELIASEREKLEQLQTEWHDKLREAEVDISVERAKLARERAGMEEQLQTLKAKVISIGGQVDEGGKAGRGRWLARLGLQDTDES